jgi:hypothetical protein
VRTLGQINPPHTLVLEHPASSNNVAKPVFVLGSGRSGTTLMGAYIGSASSMLDMGDYFGFHLSHNVAPLEVGGAPTQFRDAYLQSVKNHALTFACEMAVLHGCQYFCDSTPWNIESAPSLVQSMPNAIFILMVRHYSGVCLSLEESYKSGRRWAGATWEQRAELWKRCYDNAKFLPADRTVAVSYDRLCQDPEKTLGKMESALKALEFPTETLSRSKLAKRYASSESAKAAKRQIAVETDDGIEYRRVPSVDTARWTPDVQASVASIVAETELILLEKFPHAYDADAVANSSSDKVGRAGQ